MIKHFSLIEDSFFYFSLKYTCISMVIKLIGYAVIAYVKWQWNVISFNSCFVLEFFFFNILDSFFSSFYSTFFFSVCVMDWYKWVKVLYCGNALNAHCLVNYLNSEKKKPDPLSQQHLVIWKKNTWNLLRSRNKGR